MGHGVAGAHYEQNRIFLDSFALRRALVDLAVTPGNGGGGCRVIIRGQ